MSIILLLVNTWLSIKYSEKKLSCVMYTCWCVCQRTTSGIILQTPPACFFVCFLETGSLNDLKLTKLACKWALVIYLSPLPHLGLQLCTTFSTFKYGYRGWNTGVYVCKTSIYRVSHLTSPRLLFILITVLDSLSALSMKQFWILAYRANTCVITEAATHPPY